jgi:hypothetical protein
VAGRAAFHAYRAALELARAGRIEAITFTPFNKQAIRLVHPSYEVPGSRGDGAAGGLGLARGTRSRATRNGRAGRAKVS